MFIIIVYEVICDMTDIQSLHHCRINLNHAQSVIINVFVHTMSNDDFQYNKLLILNIFQLWHVPYTFVLYHLNNFSIGTIFWVLEIKHLMCLDCENHWFLSEPKSGCVDFFVAWFHVCPIVFVYICVKPSTLEKPNTSS